MILLQAGLELEDSHTSAVTETLLQLPGELRPSDYNFGEDERRKSLSVCKDPLRVLTDPRQPGFFLYGQAVVYDLRTARDRTIRLSCLFERPDADLRSLIVRLATAGPLFGYACQYQERIARNRVQASFKEKNQLESWVGRLPRKQLPGLYWYTLVSGDLLRDLGIPLPSLLAIAKEYEELPGSQHFFRFYDHPEDWRTATAVNRVIAEQPGIFDVADVKKAMAMNPDVTFLELSSLLARWP